MTALLEARGVSKVFGGGLLHKAANVALEDFSFRVGGSEPTITAIVGESGSGKTTLVRLLLGLMTPTTGEVLYEGTPIQSLSAEHRNKFLRDVQAIFQDPFEVYNPFYKVDHVLEAPIKNFGLAKTKAARRELMEDALKAVGLRVDETLGRYPHQLSGGQRQRVMVARSLLLRPRIIIADEPVSMVDASLRATILGSLQKLNKEYGISIVYITHDLTTAYQISDDIVVLYRGSVAEAGGVERVVSTPEHPYTRLLVGSIPLPDPSLPWAGERALGSPSDVSAFAKGPTFCKFHQRCPFAIAECVAQAPPLFKTNPESVAACYLYRDSPSIANDQMADLFAGS
jgi:peptide/nickel transport system ATP-binding protein